MYIRSSRHTIKFANQAKQEALCVFLTAYREAVRAYVDYLWDTRIEWAPGRILDIKNNRLDIPKHISTTNIPIDTLLSARSLKNASTQACAMIAAATKKQYKRFCIIRKKLGKGEQAPKNLLNKTRANPPVKPKVGKIKAELNSLCTDFQDGEGYFNHFLQLKSIGKEFGKIRLPIKNHRHSCKLRSKGQRLNSFLISEKQVEIRFRFEEKKKAKGSKVGADQGKNTTLALSDGQTTPQTDAHGHSLHSIITKLARKKKGSKAFKKAQDHRKNFIHWSINQLNFKNIKQVNLEEIRHITYKSRVSRTMSHWTNTLIRDKLKSSCLEQEVLVREQQSAYRSQRCSQCGLVRKANRRGKRYACKGCGLEIDADLNAAKNHEQELQYLSWELRKSIQENRLNYGSGFYWRAGEELTVPLLKNKQPLPLITMV